MGPFRIIPSTDPYYKDTWWVVDRWTERKCVANTYRECQQWITQYYYEIELHDEFMRILASIRTTCAQDNDQYEDAA